MEFPDVFVFHLFLPIRYQVFYFFRPPPPLHFSPFLSLSLSFLVNFVKLMVIHDAAR
jgi:hypothetical protein